MMTNNKRQQQKPLQVAVLDIDICGPSQARMFGCEQESVHSSDEGWSPITVLDNLFLMSIAFLVESRNEAIIWRGPRKNALIKQFLRDVDWGQVDFLLVDTPPGTSDEHISIVQLLLQASALDGALIVTTPQEMSLLDVRKEVNFCVKTKVPILGVVENMAEFICPCCSTSSQLFPSTTGGAAQMCKELGLQLLAKLALDPRLGKSLDQGQQSYFEQFADSPVSKQFAQLAAAVLEKCEEKNSDDVENDEQPVQLVAVLATEIVKRTEKVTVSATQFWIGFIGMAVGGCWIYHNLTVKLDHMKKELGTKMDHIQKGLGEMNAKMDRLLGLEKDESEAYIQGVLKLSNGMPINVRPVFGAGYHLAVNPNTNEGSVAAQSTSLGTLL